MITIVCLKQIIWHSTMKPNRKLEVLQELKLKCLPNVKNFKKNALDISYKFSKKFYKDPPTKRWKEIMTAIEIVKLTYYWNRKYDINCQKKVSVYMFLNYFGFGYQMLFDLGIRMPKKMITGRLMLVWLVKIKKTKAVSDLKLNNFLVELEKVLYNEKVDRKVSKLKGKKKYGRNKSKSNRNIKRRYK